MSTVSLTHNVIWIILIKLFEKLTNQADRICNNSKEYKDATDILKCFKK